jgi:glycerol transport system ATP-binding protein
MHGVHRVGIGDEIPAYLERDQLFVFDRDKNLVSAPGFDRQN